MDSIERIIRSAKREIRPMLRKVYKYNTSFLLTGNQEKLLERIIFAMSIVDRKFFIEKPAKPYHDSALAIKKGQTISQPSTVARMIILSGIKEGDNIIEVGTGSGWNAALISLIAYPGRIISIERFLGLTERAHENINKLKEKFKQKYPHDIKKIKINLKTQDIFNFKSKLKYNRIIITAGIEDLEQEKKIEKLAVRFLTRNGSLICPRTSGPLLIFKKRENELTKYNTSEKYVFVPLKKGVE